MRVSLPLQSQRSWADRSGGVGLCEYVIHLSLIDYIAVSGNMERNVLEFVDHLHEHFLYPVSINDEGRYNVPEDSKGGYSIEMYGDSMEDFSFPNGSYWVSVEKALKEGKKQPAPGGRSINH